MKVKPTSKTGGVLVELGPRESQLPSQSGASVLKLKKILVPVDFSDCSKKALAYAIPFAKQFDAELTLLHAVEPYPVPEMGPMDLETIQSRRAELEELRRSLGDSVRSTISFRTGPPHLEIVEAAREENIDLIVISTHGHTGLARMFLGSTKEKVVRHAPCPVLIVRECEREFVPGCAASPETN